VRTLGKKVGCGRRIKRCSSTSDALVLASRLPGVEKGATRSAVGSFTLAQSTRNQSARFVPPTRQIESLGDKNRARELIDVFRREGQILHTWRQIRGLVAFDA